MQAWVQLEARSGLTEERAQAVLAPKERALVLVLASRERRLEEAKVLAVVAQARVQLPVLEEEPEPESVPIEASRSL